MMTVLEKLNVAFGKALKNVQSFSANLAKHHELNFYVCALVLFVSLYVIAISVLQRPLEDPLMVQQRRQNSNGTAMRRGRIRTQQTAIDYGLSAMSMFMLWMTALIAGRLVAYLKLPEILGILLTGLAFRNIAFLHERIFVDATLNNFFRKLAFIVILIRGGIGLEANALRRMRNVILRIGVLAPLVEAAGIACACCFLFDMGIKMAFIFGIILAATSPAVSIPAVLVLNKKGFGVPDGVPTVLLVCAAVDNIVLVTPYSVLLELLFNGDGLYTQIALIFAQIATGIALGLFSGFILRYFPSINQPNYHFTRTAMLLALSMAFMYGAQATGWDSTGTVAVIIVSAVATLHWKTDNPEKVSKESNAYILISKLIGMPALFVLIGYDFDFSTVDYALALRGMIVLAIGICLRILCCYILTFGANFNRSEQIFVSLAFISKATVQAALVPQLVQLTAGTQYSTQSAIILDTCVFAILITAPFGQLILRVLGPKTLKTSRCRSPKQAPTKQQQHIQPTIVWIQCD